MLLKGTQGVWVRPILSHFHLSQHCEILLVFPIFFQFFLQVLDSLSYLFSG